MLRDCEKQKWLVQVTNAVDFVGIMLQSVKAESCHCHDKFNIASNFFLFN